LSRRVFLGAAAPAVLGGHYRGANEQIRIGVIGAGGRGQYLMGEVAKCRDLNVAITAICDVWRVNRDKGVALAAKAWGRKPRATPDYQELLGWDRHAGFQPQPDSQARRRSRQGCLLRKTDGHRLLRGQGRLPGREKQ